MQNTDNTANPERTVSILGCGWLGFPLAQYLISKKYKIKGSTTSGEKEERLIRLGVESNLIDLAENTPISSSFFDSEVLIITIPPGLRKRTPEEHLEQLRFLFSQITEKRPGKVIYTSSTSVYPDLNTEVTEEQADTSTDLFKIEEELRLLCNFRGIALSIIRFGGLMGYDRFPCKYYSGKISAGRSNSPVNYIHRDDAVQIIEQIIENDYWDTTLNAVCPAHPMREKVMEECCKTFGLPPLKYTGSHETGPFKIVSPAKLINKLKYSFKYPDPLLFGYDS